MTREIKGGQVMKVKEFKNKEIIEVTMAIYSSKLEKVVSNLKKFGISTIDIRGCFLYFKASLKQLLSMEEEGLIKLSYCRLNIDCQAMTNRMIY